MIDSVINVHHRLVGFALKNNIHRTVHGFDFMQETLAEVEISKEGDIYYAKITLPSGEVISLENEDFEEVLEQVANDLQERFGS